MAANNWYALFAKRTARATGRSFVFALSVGLIVVWLFTGPLFGFSDTWQLVINTGTTIITFLMVFLIQNTQVRDTEAIQLKLDELITHRYTLEEAPQAFDDLAQGRNARGMIIFS